MDIVDIFNISGSGLSAERYRLGTIASNLANAHSVGKPGTEAYQRHSPVFSAEPIDAFGDQFDRALATVELEEVTSTQGAEQLVFDPTNKYADSEGYVHYPDINVLHEMADMMTATRAYEANANVIDTTRDLALRALDIGR